jgi:hypothetical protein
MLPARNMIRRLRQRQLIACAAEILLPPEILRQRKLTEAKIHDEIFEMISLPATAETSASATAAAIVEGGDGIAVVDNLTVSRGDLFISVVNMGYGKGGKNPVSELTTFYQPAKELDALTGSQASSTSGNDSKAQFTVGLIPQGRFIPAL